MISVFLLVAEEFSFLNSNTSYLPPTEILNKFLFLGNYDNVWNGFNVPAKLEEMKGIGFTHVLNCAKESQNVYTEHFRYMHLPLVDDPSQELAPYLEHGFAFIDECRQSGGRIIVHCWYVVGVCYQHSFAFAFWFPGLASAGLPRW
jgi:hypothetical protein